MTIDQLLAKVDKALEGHEKRDWVNRHIPAGLEHWKGRIAFEMAKRLKIQTK